MVTSSKKKVTEAVPNTFLFIIDAAESKTSGDSEGSSANTTYKTIPPDGNEESEVDGELPENTASVTAVINGTIEHTTSIQRLFSAHSHPVTQATTLSTTVHTDGSSSATAGSIAQGLVWKHTIIMMDIPILLIRTHHNSTEGRVELKPHIITTQKPTYRMARLHSWRILEGNDDDSTSTYSLKIQSPAGEYGGFTVSNKNTGLLSSSRRKSSEAPVSSTENMKDNWRTPSSTTHTLTTLKVASTLLNTYKELPSIMDLNTHKTVTGESSSSNSYATDFEHPTFFFSIHPKRTTLPHSNPKDAPATHSSSSHTSNRGVATTTISGAVRSTTSSIHTPELQRTAESPNTKERTLLTTSPLFAETARGTSSKSDFSATPFSFMSSQGTIQSTKSSESLSSASIPTTFTPTIPENTKLIHHSSAHDQVHENISDEETTTRATNALTTKNTVTPLTTLSLMTSANKKQVDELPLNTSATSSTVETLESVLELSDRFTNGTEHPEFGKISHSSTAVPVLSTALGLTKRNVQLTNGTEHPETKTTSYSLTAVPTLSTIAKFTERNTEFKNETEHPELRITFHTSATTSTLGTSEKLTKRHFLKLFSPSPPKMMGSMLSITEQQTSQPSSQRHTNSTSTSAPSSKAVFLQFTETTLEDELRTEKSTVGSYTSRITSPETTPNTIFSSTLPRIDGTSFSEDHSRLKTLPYDSRDKTSFTTTISASTKTSEETTRRALEECEKPCPSGYIEGPAYCYRIIPIKLSKTYRKALGFCQTNDNSDLARQQDFLDPEVIRVAKELSQQMNIPTTRFFINERTYRNRGKLRLVDINGTDGSTLVVNSTVSANEVVLNVAALCRKTSMCL
ncbi:hypothetical protein NECAME_11826 [Necator americanus]|uniref:Uncharacterized protein n=1 Tax=Necator americanus TaxID=51031 RepID=W2T3V6_NECAM|nr:hypothetical protein NECAME_11826 [Necator americanus]ETN76234.1 hypothetical protein NECAME_11826 [Necator americanus]